MALITGGDSGIGRPWPSLSQKRAPTWPSSTWTRPRTRRKPSAAWKSGRRCVAIAGDVGDEGFCRQAVERTVRELGKLDVLVNNAAEQHPQAEHRGDPAEQLERTFRTNIFGSSS